MYKLKKIFKNEKGQGMVEYGLVLALVSIVAVLGLGTLGGNINDRLEGIADSMSGISEPGKESGYSDEEIDDLINQGYIPVATAEELNSVRDGLGNKYVQVADIDLSEYSGEGWTPIGTGSSSFRGTYDGGNYVITDLEVKGEGKDHQGLFGYIIGATIENVALEDVNVNGRDRTGGLVGEAINSSITNSYATGSVSGGKRTGGLVGWAYDYSTITNSYATGSVKGTGSTGGLVGRAGSLNSIPSTITNSYATGSVMGTGNNTGGLVGESDNSTITNSYATGSVEGKDNVGGLVGDVDSSTISNSYSTGSATGSGGWVGGLVGIANEPSTISNSYATGSVSGDYNIGGLVGETYGTITNSYWDTETTGRTRSSGGGTGKSTNEMMLKETYEGWDFDTTWKIDEGEYPTLR